MFNINDIVNKDNYTEAAIFCNKAGDRHIEKQGEQYVIVANPPAPEPTVEEQVARMEAETGLTRVMREIVLAEGSGVSDYVKAKAREIETLAVELRPKAETEETVAVQEATAAGDISDISL